MSITATTGEGVTVLEVAGEIDLQNADELRDAGIKALIPFIGTLRIDLSGVTFMDSTGLAALVAIRNHASDHHLVLIQNPSARVQRILKTTGLDQVFESGDERVS